MTNLQLVFGLSVIALELAQLGVVWAIYDVVLNTNKHCCRRHDKCSKN